MGWVEGGVEVYVMVVVVGWSVYDGVVHYALRWWGGVNAGWVGWGGWF